ncbi:MAG: hypothetical protein LBM13_04160 [Candidatus Ancillula sp.]|nr:hypothetical protein [Candidatus Ancillula sp.]
MKQKHYLLILTSHNDPFAEVFYNIFAELYNKPNVDIFEGVYKPIPKILKPLWTIHTAKHLNQKINLPFKSIWNHWITFNNYKIDPNQEYYIIIQNVALIKRFNIKALTRLTDQPNVHLIYDILDPFEDPVSNSEMLKVLPFERVITYSKEDAEKYHFEHLLTPYSVLFPKLTQNINQEHKYKMIFVGGNPNIRGEILNQIFTKLHNKLNYTKKNLFFDLVDVNNDYLKIMNSENTKRWNINKFLPYKQMLQETIKSNVILEISSTQNHQSPSLRYYEAVVYNKKLLTNIQAIKNYPFYNPKYMKIFNSIDDIDEELLKWIDSEEIIDYKYDGQFSPEKLLDLAS